MILDAVRYGHNVLWAVTVAGIPVVWIERVTGKTLPTGYTGEDGSLVVDDSGDIGIEHVDRQRGVAVAMPLRFKLLDTDTTRDWIRKWSKLMTLTADLEVADLAATVDDTTGWANGDEAWLGMERIEIGNVASPTSITNLTRATVDTLLYRHQVGTTAQVITDRPRFWRGRDVVLWAVPVDPSGYVPGSTLLADAIQVWRGRIELGPVREIDGFAFEAGDLSRVLDQPLIGEVTGRLVDTTAKYPVAKGWSASVYLFAQDNTDATVWSYDLQLTPFGSDADGDMLSVSEIHDRISDEWDAQVSAAGGGGDLGELKWTLAKSGFWVARVKIKNNAAIVVVKRLVALDNKDVWFEEDDPKFGTGMTADAFIPIGWQHKGNPLVAYSALDGKTGATSLTMQLDSGAISDVPDAGRLRVQIGNASWVYEYSGTASTGADLYLANVKPLQGAKLDVLTSSEAVGASCAILFTVEGTPKGLMLATLESSGTVALRGSYDILARGQGYSIDETAAIKPTSFESLGAPFTSLACEVVAAGATFADLFGGLLGLFRAAVVCRPDTSETDRQLKLQLVSTAPYGAGWATTISDADLLSHDGDPVLQIERAEAPNVVTVRRPLGTQGDEADTLTLADNTAAEAQGRREVEYRIPAKSKDVLWPIAKAGAASQLAADQVLQVLSIRVAPWVLAEVGDVVYLDLSHPALWTWNASPATSGYEGPARVVGRKLNPRTLQATLTLLIDGAVTIRALSPAAAITAYQHATNPTWIEIPLQYLDHMTNALADAGGPVWLYHYKAGAVETVGERHQVSAAASVGGFCRLTVVANPTGHTLSVPNRSTLTLPTLTGGHVSTWQTHFAHVDDGTSWG